MALQSGKSVDARCGGGKLIDAAVALGFGQVIVEAKEGLQLTGAEQHPAILATRRTVQILKAKGSKYESLKAELIRAREECDIVVLSGDQEMVLRRILEASDEWLIDAVHITPDSIAMFKPGLLRIIREKGIFLEFSVCDFMEVQNRGRCLTNARHVVRTYVRRQQAATNLILSSGAVRENELRSREELVAIGALLGLRKEDIDRSLDISPFQLVESAYRRKIMYRQLRSKQGTIHGIQHTPIARESSKRSAAVAENTVEERRLKAVKWNGR